MLTAGSEGLYEWLVTDQQFNLLQVCPEVALEKYLVITSIDSGSLVPTEKDTETGWQSRGNIAYSPKLKSVDEVPFAGWEEWYIFDKPVDLGTSHIAENIFEAPQELGHLSVFVNYGFALHPPERKGLATLFWPQIERIRPESYVADNDYLTFGSENKGAVRWCSRCREGPELEQSLS